MDTQIDVPWKQQLFVEARLFFGVYLKFQKHKLGSVNSS